MLYRFREGNAVEWRAAYDERQESWIAVCDALDINASAETWRELMDQCGEMTETVLAMHLDDGRLDEVQDTNELGLDLVDETATTEAGFDVPYVVTLDPSVLDG